jgi:hypothetical protein
MSLVSGINFTAIRLLKGGVHKSADQGADLNKDEGDHVTPRCERLDISQIHSRRDA